MGEPISSSDNLTTELSLLSIGPTTSTASSSSTSSNPLTTSSSEDPNSSTNGPSLSLASPTTTTISSSRDLISTPPLSTPQTPQQPSFIQIIPLQTKDEVKLTLSQPPGVLKELFLDRIYLDDELIWLLIESKLERLYLQNCTFDINGPDNFAHILEYLISTNSSKPYFRFVVQSNDYMTQWILYKESSNLELIDNGHVDSLILHIVWKCSSTVIVG